MLVLPCRLGRALFVGRDIRVTIVSIEGDEVRVGIDAPAHIRVSRDDISFELHLKRQAHREKDPDRQDELFGQKTRVHHRSRRASRHEASK